MGAAKKPVVRARRARRRAVPRSAEQRALLESIAANVQRLRIEKGYSQARLAEQASLDLTTVQRLERGDLDVHILVLDAVARAIGASFDELAESAQLPKRALGRPPGRKYAPVARRRA